jgi:drug/metabolite transporter (DMT)-like permease
VLLGVWLAHEFLSGIQVAGLTIIIASVVLINLAKLRREKQSVAAANKRVPAIPE